VPELVLRALRGATTVDVDTEEQVTERVRELVAEMLARNDVGHEDLVSVIFTATDDVHSMFPATAARGAGLGDVPLLCARELDVTGAMPRCIRILMHLYSVKARDGLHHVYLHGTRSLRDDLPD
jgi:chorismate mutase